MTSISGKLNSANSTIGESASVKTISGEWKKTGCVPCAQNRGLEVLVENNRIVKSKPDRENPRSKGYVCRKGLYVADSITPNGWSIPSSARGTDSSVFPGIRRWTRSRTS